MKKLISFLLVFTLLLIPTLSAISISRSTQARTGRIIPSTTRWASGNTQYRRGWRKNTAAEYYLRRYYLYQCHCTGNPAPSVSNAPAPEARATGDQRLCPPPGPCPLLEPCPSGLWACGLDACLGGWGGGLLRIVRRGAAGVGSRRGRKFRW